MIEEMKGWIKQIDKRKIIITTMGFILTTVIAYYIGVLLNLLPSIFVDDFENVQLKIFTDLNDWHTSKDSIEVIVTKLRNKADLTVWIYRRGERVFYRQAIKEISEDGIYKIKTWPQGAQEIGDSVRVFATLHKRGKAPPNLKCNLGYWFEQFKADATKGGFEGFLSAEGYKVYAISDVKYRKFEGTWKRPDPSFNPPIPPTTLEIVTNLDEWDKDNSLIDVNVNFVDTLSTLTLWIHSIDEKVYYRQGFVHVSRAGIYSVRTWPKGVQDGNCRVEIIATLHPYKKAPPDEYWFQAWKAELSQTLSRYLAWQGCAVLAISPSLPPKRKHNWEVGNTHLNQSNGNHNRISKNSLWVWEPTIVNHLSKQDSLLAFCFQKNIGTLYLNVGEYFDSSDISQHKSNISKFLSRAHNQGLKVHALDGAPKWCLTENHSIPLLRLQSIVDYNRQYESKFDGFQFDIEPYILSDFHTAKRESILIQFINLIKKTTTYLDSVKIKFSLGYAIPFWFDEEAEHLSNVNYNHLRKPATYHIVDVLNKLESAYLAIMAYRDHTGGPDGSIRHVQDEIQYVEATDSKVSIIIGQETNNVRNEPEKITFWQEGEKALNEAIFELQNTFKKRKAFGGIAIHYYKSYRLLKD